MVPSLTNSRRLLQSNVAALPNTLSHATSCQLQNIQGFSSAAAWVLHATDIAQSADKLTNAQSSRFIDVPLGCDSSLYLTAVTKYADTWGVALPVQVVQDTVGASPRHRSVRDLDISKDFENIGTSSCCLSCSVQLFLFLESCI